GSINLRVNLVGLGERAVAVQLFSGGFVRLVIRRRQIRGLANGVHRESNRQRQNKLQFLQFHNVSPLDGVVGRLLPAKWVGHNILTQRRRDTTTQRLIEFRMSFSSTTLIASLRLRAFALNS